jgi:GntR family transcriptional regulator
MLVTLDPRDDRPLYLQIMDQVRRALLDGTLRAEDPLPSVRDLAGELVVNPRTVSQAYRELEGEGVIYVRRGQGTFVAPSIHPDRRERRGLVRGVAERALIEARRNGLGVEELLTMIREVAADDEVEGSQSSSAVTSGEEGGAA